MACSERYRPLLSLTPNLGIFCGAIAGQVFLERRHRFIDCGIPSGSPLGRPSRAQRSSRLCLRARRQSGFFLRRWRLASLSSGPRSLPVVDSPRLVCSGNAVRFIFALFARKRCVVDPDVPPVSIRIREHAAPSSEISCPGGLPQCGFVLRRTAAATRAPCRKQHLTRLDARNA